MPLVIDQYSLLPAAARSMSLPFSVCEKPIGTLSVFSPFCAANATQSNVRRSSLLNTTPFIGASESLPAHEKSMEHTIKKITDVS